MLFKIKEIKKSKRYEIRLTEEERSELQKRADANNLDLSKYLIRCGLGRPIATSNTAGLVLELMNLAKIQKELYQGGEHNKQQYQDILIAIVSAISSIPHRIAKIKSNSVN